MRHEISGARLRGLLALLARDLRSGCGTAALVDGLWPGEQHVHDGTAALRHLRVAWLGRDKLGNWPDAIGIR